jgi:predicted MFS family arabinose efflux permease
MTGPNRAVVRSLMISSLALYFGFGIWQGLFNNFAVEAIGIRADQIGLLQSLREIPGLLGFWLAFLALVMAELDVLSLSAVVMGVGMIATGMAQSWTQLIFGVLVTSIGFHAFYPNASAVALLLTDERETPRLLGVLQMVAALAAVAASLTIVILVGRLGFSRLFYATGALTILGGILSWSRRGLGTRQTQRRRIILRRRYWLYYLLTFLLGSRRHIFTTFAIFLLVREFGMPAQQTALLFLINSVLGVLLYRRAGVIVGRFGERPVLAISFVLLIAIFIGYATIHSLAILAALFVADNFLAGLEFALSSYFKKIAVTPEEITSNLSLSQTINHLAAVFVPILGGIAWEMFDPSVPFLAGVVIMLISLGLLWFMRPVRAPVVATAASPAP